MSVLICSICEQNRTAITSAVREAIQALGTHATGLSPFLGKLICLNCGSKEKLLSYKYWFSGDEACRFQIESDEKGNYSIHLQNPIDQFADINLLSIINHVQSQINNIETEHEIDSGFYKIDGTHYPEKYLVWIKNSGNSLQCKCGHRYFQPLV